MAATQLTDRERQIRTLVADGLTNDDIAVRLKISSRTVESHLRMLFRKLNVTRREQINGSERALPSPGDETERVQDLEQQLATYETAIRQIADRQQPLFRERAELTVTIGDTAAEDAIEERRWTTPHHYLVYRLTRPTLPHHKLLTPEELAPAYEVVGRDIGVAGQAIRDRKHRYQLLVTFQPGLQEETEWVVSYRTPGLWDPLREQGADSMAWFSGVLDESGTKTSVTELTVRFVFPLDTTAMDATERRTSGVTEEQHLSDGRRALVWHDSRLRGGDYKWVLKMTRELKQR